MDRRTISHGPNDGIASDTEDTIPGTRYFAVLTRTARLPIPDYRYRSNPEPYRIRLAGLVLISV